MTTRIDGSPSLLAAAQARIALLKGRADLTAKALFAGAEDDERVKRAKSALGTLTQANNDARSRRKAEARAKVDRLKQELEMLRRFAGGDPKVIARQAARIARELAAAAREYASGAGTRLADGPVDAAVGTDGEASADANAADETPAADAADRSPADAAEAQGSEVGTAEGEAEGQGVVAAEAKAAAAEAEAAAAKAASGEDKTAGHKDPQADPGYKVLPDPEQQRQAQVAQFQAKAAAIIQRGAEGEADAKFVADVRALYASLKAWVEQARRSANADRKNDGEYDALVKVVKDAGADITQSLGGTGGLMLPAQLMV
jgi:hypothetical protein